MYLRHLAPHKLVQGEQGIQMTQSIVDTDTFVFDSQGQHCSRHVRCVARAELTVTASRRRFSAQHKAQDP